MDTRQVLIQNEGDLGSASDASDPTEVGEAVIAAFDSETGESKTIFNGTPANIEDLPESFFFVQGTGGDGYLRTSLLEKSRIASVEKREYVAPVKEGVVVAVTADEGDARIKLVDTTNYQREFVNVETRVEEGDTAEEVAQRLADRVNDVQLSAVITERTTTEDRGVVGFTALTDGASLGIQADHIGQTFEAVLLGTLSGADIEKTNVLFGSGTGSELLSMEKASDSGYGEYYVHNPLLGSPDKRPRFAEAEGQYTYYIIRHKNDQEDSINRAFKYQEIILAVESSVTGTLDTFFGDLLSDNTPE